METIICALISAFSAVAVAVVSAVSLRNQKKQDKRAERRKEESLLSLELMVATMDLSTACCNALCGGHNNGNVQAAKDRAQKAHDKYVAFERKILTEEII